MVQRLGRARREERAGELKQLELAWVEGVREQQGYSKHRVALGRREVLEVHSTVVELVEDPEKRAC
jgi:hypothetical protein